MHFDRTTRSCCGLHKRFVKKNISTFSNMIATEYFRTAHCDTGVATTSLVFRTVMLVITGRQ
jgi:hypothetical protein